MLLNIPESAIQRLIIAIIWSGALAFCLVFETAYAAPSHTATAAETKTRAAHPEAAKTIIILPFDLVDTSMQAEMNHGSLASDVARMKRTQKVVRKAVSQQLAFHVLSNAPVHAAIKDAEDTYRYLYECNGCEIDIGRKASADLVMTGWLQKVSNLILNINAAIFDVKAGKQVAIASVSMRGDTDESWTDSARYMINERLMKSYRQHQANEDAVAAGKTGTP